MTHRSTARDFDCLLGRWNIANRWLGPDGQWHDFRSTAEVTAHVDGLVLVDEYSMPAFPTRGPVTALNIRAFDRTTAQWSLVWLASYAAPDLRPVVGAWVSDVEGRFFQTVEDDGGRLDVRFIYRRLGADIHWEQALSWDARRTWKANWTMHFVRAAEAEDVP